MALKTRLEIRDGLDNKTHEFTGVEAELIQTGEFQRLNYINTLGVSYLVYPSAQMKRYSHCIGSSILAKEFAKTLGLDEKQKNIISIAMLLHDIGHGPFSHVSDFGPQTHEDRSVGLITGDLKMDGKFCGKIPSILKTHGIEPEDIAQVLQGTYEKDILNQLASGYFDLDKADYLRRDSHATGAKIGTIDLERIKRIIHPNEDGIYISEEGLDDFIHFVDARKYMYRNVYHHKKTQVFETMIRLAFSHSNIDLQNKWFMNDVEALGELKSDKSSISREIAELVYANVPYDRMFMGYSLCSDAIKSFNNFKSVENIEDVIEKHAGLEKGDVVVLLRNPAPPKEPQFQIKTHTGQMVNVFEYSEKARNAALYPESVYYAQVAVHPSVEGYKKEKANQIAESIAKE